MTAFSTMDVRAPDQRRKHLIQKLMAQASSAGQAAGRQGAVSALRGAAGTFGGGPTFGNGRRSSPNPNVTQGSNILPAILAKLGVTGSALGNEASASPGAPIPSYGDLQSILAAAISARGGHEDQGAPIPTDELPGGGDPGAVAASATAPSSPYSPMVDVGGGNNGGLATDTPSPQPPPMIPQSVSGSYNYTPPIPLSVSGSFYDPVLDALLNPGRISPAAVRRNAL